jgi:hypothetical protein
MNLSRLLITLFTPANYSGGQDDGGKRVCERVCHLICHQQQKSSTPTSPLTHTTMPPSASPRKASQKSDTAAPRKKPAAPAGGDLRNYVSWTPP